ncbi:MAG: sugar transferase [Firmicutes bacterium HGW-Firmicutes-8]|nr:MAG: sugar transferase [Firmicutes bacterium HGW-Firmicutes-8]
MWLTNSKSKYSVLIMLADVAVINFSIILAYLIRFKFTLPEFNFQPYLQMFFWISLGGLFFFNLYHLYSVSPRTRWDDQFYSIILAVALTLMLSISLTYISANYSFPRSVFLLSGFLQVVFLLGWRYFLWRLTKRVLGVQRAVIIGTQADSLETAGRIKEFSESHIDIIGFINDEVDQEKSGDEEYPILGAAADFEYILAQTDCDVVVVTPSIDAALKEQIVCSCFSAGKEVFLIPDLYEVLVIKADLNIIDDIPVFMVKDYIEGNNSVKRLLDVVIGALAFIITLPVMSVVAVMVKLDSPGPAIYKQERVTRGGRAFTLYKFRTMVQDAEVETGPVFALEEDQRATRVGRILRLSRLDELPQLINVIKGDMSLVGPRPERPFFVEQYSKEINGYDNRHRMKPGITGIAQIAGKYNTGPREKLVFDLLYAKRNNILVDLQILLHTVKALFMRDKAS